MLPDYADIRALTDREPDWFTEGGVPRYAPFHPEMLGVYDQYAVLALIACQSCRQRFRVGIGRMKFERDFYDRVVGNTLRNMTEGFRFGDPPSHGCVGDTMSSESLLILEAWWRESSAFRAWWTRDHHHEGTLPTEE